MMKGYLNTSNTSTTVVGVTSLPAAVTANGYDVYVYCDDDTIGVVRNATYVIGTTAYSTTCPSVTGKENVSIILKPSSALEYVQIMGTKPSCSVDTGITATSNLRKIGFTGLIPIAPDSTTFAQASVAAP